jgi:subtilisin family serine protease
VDIHQGWTTSQTNPGTDSSRLDEDEMDTNADGSLDRQAGHGTFVAGIIRQHAPDAIIHVQGVLSSFGDGDDWDVSNGITKALNRSQGQTHVINMSFGGYTDDDLPFSVLADAVVEAQNQGAIVVAAAGNANSCRPFWPACLPGVIAVGATHCGKRAWFSNFGPWVKACAPGVDIVSTFYEFDGPASNLAGLDPDRYHGWATWSGTSFAAPHVTAAIADRMCERGLDPLAAASEVIGEGTPVEDLGNLVHMPRSANA